MLHNDGPMTEIEYRLRWTQSYLKKDGLIENASRGVWSLLERGREITTAELSDIKAIGIRIHNKIQRTKNQANIAQLELTQDETTAEDVDEELEWNVELLDTLKAMDPIAFERLSQRMLRESGFTKVTVTSPSNDKGIDGVGVLRMNLVSFQVMFQCKRYSGTVGPGAIRDFRGAMQGRSDKGLMITTGTFTAEARREAIRDGAPTIDLIDGDALCDLLKRLGLGVSVKMVEEVVIDTSFFKSI